MSTTPGGPERRLTVRRLMMWIAGIAFAIASLPLVARLIGDPPTRLRLAECNQNLRQVALGVQGYINRHGSLPPAYVADASGKPLYSWRALILPYLDMGGVDSPTFHYDEPWDSPRNLRFVDHFPNPFACPAHDHDHEERSFPTDRLTSYFALRGPDNAFPGPAPVPLGRITDRLDRTILFVESDQGGVPYSAPVDIDAATGRLTWAAPGDPIGPISPHNKGVSNVLMADGSVHRLTPAELKRVMAPMSTIAGGEAVEIGDR